jgi:hypothetical protein
MRPWPQESAALDRLAACGGCGAFGCVALALGFFELAAVDEECGKWSGSAMEAAADGDHCILW